MCIDRINGQYIVHSRVNILVLDSMSARKSFVHELPIRALDGRMFYKCCSCKSGQWLAAQFSCCMIHSSRFFLDGITFFLRFFRPFVFMLVKLRLGHDLSKVRFDYEMILFRIYCSIY